MRERERERERESDCYIGINDSVMIRKVVVARILRSFRGGFRWVGESDVLVCAGAWDEPRSPSAFVKLVSFRMLLSRIRKLRCLDSNG